MTDSDFERALNYAETALGLMRKGAIPPYPQYYELLYTYASGIIPELNARMNALLRDGSVAPSEIAKTLYEEFLRGRDHESRLNEVTEQISGQLHTVHSFVDQAMDEASSYSGWLEQAADQLDTDLDKASLNTLATRLLRQTTQMQDANQRLEAQLKSSRDNIESLQEDLEAVQKEALTDPLTRISNRKAFDQGLARAIERSNVTDTPLCLIILDIDYFKKFNDTHGHQTGDQVLRLVASMLGANIEQKALAARYGGEEFALILPETGLEAARTLGERIRKAIQVKKLLKRSTNEQLGRITASFGVAELGPDDNAASLIERADQCLYLAKSNGRNRVVAENGELYESQHNAA